MDNLEKFDFKGKEVRTLVGEDGAILWVAVDVAKALGYKDPYKAIKQHCKDWVKCPVPDAGGKNAQSAILINEPNLYRLTINSKLPSAVAFEKWVFEEVLPSLRKYRHYDMPEITDGTKMFAIRAMADSYKKQAELAIQKTVQMKNILGQWLPTNTFGEISERNGKPRLQKRRPCFVADGRYKCSVAYDPMQGVFKFYDEMLKQGGK